jgi:hypothetical protein
VENTGLKHDGLDLTPDDDGRVPWWWGTLGRRPITAYPNPQDREFPGGVSYERFLDAF